jgi:hypothetical protein
MNITANDSIKHREHSKFGIISFGLAMTIILILILLTLLALIVKNDPSLQIIFGQAFYIFGLMIAPILNLAGLILGIAGAFRKDSQKLFSILGIVFNAVELVIIAGIWLVFGILLYFLDHMVWR